MADATTSQPVAPGAPAAPPAPAAGAPSPVEVAPATPAAPAAPAEPSTPAAPAELSFKLPEGVQLDEAGLGKFREFAKSAGLTSEQAEKVLALTHAANVEAQKAAADAHSKRITEWETALKADKELGGAAFEATKAAAQKAIVKFGSDALKELFESTALGSHPEMVRFVARVGKAMAEDSIAGTSGAPAPTGDDLLRKLYPNSPQMFGAQ